GEAPSNPALSLPPEDGEPPPPNSPGAPRTQVKEEGPQSRPEAVIAPETEVLGTDGEGSTHSAGERAGSTGGRRGAGRTKGAGGQAGLGRGCGRRLGGWHSGKGRGTERGGHGRAWAGTGGTGETMGGDWRAPGRLGGSGEVLAPPPTPLPLFPGVLSEEQLRKKKVRRQQQKGAGGEAPLPQVPPLPPTPLAEPARLSPQQELMIRQLVAAQQQCNKRSFSDQPKVTPWPLGTDPNSREARQQRFAHFTELAIISVQEIVDFAKQVPGFLQLTREDQIALLKACTIEIMLLETARRYNHETESITFLKDFTYSKDDFHRAGARAGGGGGCGGDRLMFPRMLMKLVALRTLSSVHSEQVFALRLQDKKLPPLLSEIWDVHE
uniref:Nuclear receptor subfamily 1 group H member 2 n=1 Tax=Chrysemys picta bellii TaxID=8478 RepID=A0A8C3FWW2_CHRPI